MDEDTDQTAAEAAVRHAMREVLSKALAQWKLEQRAVPPGEEDRDMRIQAHNVRLWQRILYEHGWAGISIPREFGGRGDGVALQIAFNEESQRAGAPPMRNLFVAQFLVAPTLIQFGSAQQNRAHVRPILKGEQVWCQLFSEPDAGSDLASLRTRAVREGDRWLINGQKVWSSSAHLADYGILLARSNVSAPKHKGITAFILDMKAKGVSVRPLRKMGGGYGFNEVFFDNVEIGDANRIGEVDAGWRVALAALGYERLGLTGTIKADVGGLAALAMRSFPLPGDRPAFVNEGIATLYARSLAINALGQEAARVTARGGPPGPRGSVGKLMLGALMNDAADFALRIQGHPDGALVGADAPDDGAWQAALFEAPARRISGGADQIQRGIVAEHILGMPRTRGAA